MATKTFKIGLSNTDKQNMAQDVYERVLALTFAEYDSANTYNKGDFVVYDDTLYQCKQDNTTGTWDSSKWQQATLQDLLDDIEGAVAFVNDKANVDGNYPTMTVGAADNLTPYDEDSGTDQEQPFLLQGTGCGNGEQQVDTGALALLKEKQGNSVVVNQLAKALNSTNWSLNDMSGGSTIADGVATFTATRQYASLTSSQKSLINGHKYWFGLEIKPTTNLTAGQFSFVTNTGNTEIGIVSKTATAGQWNFLSVVAELTLTPTQNNVLYFYDNRSASWDEIQVKEPLVIDLTQWFGSNDNIPAHLLSHPEDFFRYYQGSLAYNEGTLVNSNGRYLKTIGRQQWDEEWESGIYVYGNPTVEANYIRSKNFISVIPGAKYYYDQKDGSRSNYLMIEFHDKDKNFITRYSADNHEPFDVPVNACYMRFYVNDAYGTAYNHDITISIYYEGESGYDQYYPYEELANIDTGTETLRSAGSVKDSKTPDGTITRRVGSVDLGSLEWVKETYPDPGITLFVADIPQRKPGSASLVCSKYVSVNGPRTLLANTDKAISSFNAIDSSGICIRDDEYTDATAFKAAMSGVLLFYELAEPTTEQGTTFSENVTIDDFGSMDFGGTNGVPQGASIFYAVDYKAFVDSLYNTLDGDATDIVKESELDTKLAALGYVKLTSVSGYDATKTQVLKNVEGTLTWVTEE